MINTSTNNLSILLCTKRFQMIFENIEKEILVAALNYIDIHHIIT